MVLTQEFSGEDMWRVSREEIFDLFWLWVPIPYNSNQIQQAKQILSSERQKSKGLQKPWSSCLETDTERKTRAQGTPGKHTGTAKRVKETGRAERQVDSSETCFNSSPRDLWT